MKRLLFISNLFPDAREPYRGLDNATILHALRDRFKIRVLALRPSLPLLRRRHLARAVDAPLSPRFLPVPYVPKVGSALNHRLYAKALKPALAQLRGEYDVILTSWIYPDSCAVSRIAETPFLSIAQGSDVHQYLRIPARKKIILEHMPAASAIITRSGELARLLAEAGLDTTRLHPVYNGVDLSTFHPVDALRKRALRKELGLPETAPVVLFVGNFLPVKNPHIVIEGHRTLRTILPPAWLVLIGGGPLEKALRASVRQNVTFAGRQDAAAVARYMQAADCLVLPSVNEGVPNVILEAFACGLPVVASRVGGIPEVHNADFLGRLIQPGPLALADAVVETLAACTDGEKIAAHGSTFTWDRAATCYAELLESALG